ncbi:ferredoxin [Sesbania bispinosa]|nr:ferredoxin [Sesbania bispinosa]
MVEETQTNMENKDEGTQVNIEHKDNVIGERLQEEFPTTIGESLRRKLVSYRDACIGINGPSVEYSSSDWEISEGDEAEDSEDEIENLDMDTDDSEDGGPSDIR